MVLETPLAFLATKKTALALLDLLHLGAHFYSRQSGSKGGLAYKR